ncbi:MAG: MFS transporter [Phycisphaerales bacterium]|nr:MAG: MFS transporter [Phycisphaerales bacterium]
MTDNSVRAKQKLNWRFPRTFWIANGAELFERAAYYGMAIALAVYLTDQIGFSDVWTGYVYGAFASVLYLMPTFTGIMADKIGFRRALILAFALLTFGYLLLGVAGMQIGQTLVFSEVPRKLIVLAALAIIMFGGSIIKPVISGTVAVCSDEAHRARAFSIFYAVVNIGAFIGKSLAAPLRQELGLEWINYYAASMALCALVFVALFYRAVTTEGKGKTVAEALDGLFKVVRNFRFMCLILIVAGFWAIQHQLYASMPKYILRMLGEGARPEWLANINPLVVVLLVVPITHLVRRVKPVNTIAVALLIIPLSSLTISLSPALESVFGGKVPVNLIVFRFAMHPITLMVIIGIALQGLAECFLSPKWLEYASNQAPKGEVGLYMGYMHLSSFFAYLFGFIISGYLLDWYCPDPNKLPQHVQEARLAAIEAGTSLPEAYAHAHYIWYVFAAIGALAFAGLVVFKIVTNAIDRRRTAEA